MKKTILSFLIVTFFSIVLAAPPEQALLSHWRFDEKTGDHAADSSPIRNLPANILNGEWVKGVSGNAVHFKGNGYGTTAMPGSVIPLDSFTVDFYFMVDDGKSYHYVMGAKNVPAPGESAVSFFVRICQGTFLEAGFATPQGWQEVRYYGQLKVHQWYRFTMIVEAKRYRAFLDGQQFGEKAIAGIRFNNALIFCPGSNSWDHDNSLKGAIDELKFYNHALTPEELFDENPLAAEKKSVKERWNRVAKYHLLQKLVFEKPLPDEYTRISGMIKDYTEKCKDVTPALAELEKAMRTPDYREGALVSVYPVSPTSPIPILPNDDPSGINLVSGKTLVLLAGQGEYEAVSFVVRAKKELKKLSLSVELPRFPKDQIDAKYLACWFRDGGAWSRDTVKGRSLPVAVPELLVNDPEFTERRFDEETPLTADDGSKVIPVRDAKNLLPCKLAANRNQQYMITFRTNENTMPGLYKGTVILAEQGKEIARIPLAVRVLDVKLGPAMTRYKMDRKMEYSVYYWGHPSKDNVVPLGGYMRSMSRFKAEMLDLASHGITSPAFAWRGAKLQYERPEENSQGIRYALDAGMCRDAIFFAGSIDCHARTPQELDAVRIRVPRFIQMLRKIGVSCPVYIYGQDEQTTKAQYEAQYPVLKIIHDSKAKNWVSTFPHAFAIVGKSGYLDLANAYGVPSREEAAKWHSIGARVWNYGAPQAGEWDPSVYRRNAGVVLWSCNYDGFCDYCYSDPFVKDFAKKANPYLMGYSFVLPTVDGVIDTLAWEGFREASDDVRFISTLRELARTKGAAELKKTDAFLDSFEPHCDDVELIRYQVVEAILNLNLKGKK